MNNFFMKIILLSIILQIPFQDFFLRKILGIFGTNMSLITINVFFLILFITNLKKVRIHRSYLFIFFYILIVSTLFLILTDFFVKNENLIFKVIKNFILYSQPVIVFYIFNFLYKNNPKLIKASVNISFYIFVFLFIYLMVDSIGIFTLDNNPIIHGSENLNMRPRLFSPESSMAVTTFVTFGLIAILKNKNFLFKIAIITCILVGSTLLKSKGGILTLILVSFLALKNLKIHYKFAFLLIGFVTFFLFMDFFKEYIFFNNIISGLETYTSLSTRLTMIIASTISLLYQPFGFGFGAYLQFFDSNIIKAKEITEQISNWFGLVPNFNEVDSYLISAKNYATKTMLFNLIIFFGWVGLFIFIYFHHKIYKKIKNNNALKILFFFLLIEHSFFVDSLYLYNFWFAFAFIYNYWRVECIRKY